MAGPMKHDAELTSVREMGSNLFTRACRIGMEAGLRRMAIQCQLDVRLLEKAIRQMDKEFDHVCPCTSFKDGLCERCGSRDVFSVSKDESCTSPKPMSG